MCEAAAYLLRDGEEELVLENVNSLVYEDDKIKMTDIFGETKKIKARLKGLSLIDHKIILEPL